MDAIWQDGGTIVVHVCMGISLAACAGLRAFLPLLVVGLAGRMDLVPLSPSFTWLESWPALVVFGSAVLAEVSADKFPVVDHVLDSVQAFVKPVAGALVMATAVDDWGPLYVTVFWMVVGGSTAGLVHVAKAKLRLVSSVTTAGTGNPLLSTAEDVGALTGSVASITIPPLAVLAVGLFAVVVWLALRRLRRRPA